MRDDSSALLLINMIYNWVLMISSDLDFDKILFASFKIILNCLTNDYLCNYHTFSVHNASTRTALVSPVENGRITYHIWGKLFSISVRDSFMFSITFLSFQLRVGNKNIFLFSQPNHMLWAFQRTVSMRQFF